MNYWTPATPSKLCPAKKLSPAKWLAAILLFLSPFASVSALADQIVLVNGDRITGTIDSADGGKIIVTSPITGKLTIDMANVKTFSTDGPIKIVLSDGSVINQRVTEGSAGTFETAAGGTFASQSVPLAKIDKINPAAIAWNGNVVVNGSLSQGDTYSEQIGLSADLFRRTTIDRIEMQGAYQFAKQKVNGITSTSLDQWNLEASYNYFLTKKFYVLGDVRVEKNRIQNLDLRVTPNVGAGYQFVERPDFNANVEGGLAWVYEDYTNIAAPNENVSLRLAYHIDKTLWDRLKLFSDCAYFPSLENSSKYIILADAGARLSLTKTFFTELKGIVNYDSHPAPQSHRTQTQLILGVGWTF
jgi:putative salt-induced outer membrane protein YdiY